MPMLRNALIYFNQAIRDGSIRKAAETLHIASSAINRQLLQLEEEMGVELFVRSPRGIRPTSAGEALLAYIRRWEREAAQLRQEISRLKGGIRGTIRIAAAESLTEDILPKAMARLQVRYPLVDFTLMSGDNSRIKSELLAKEADIVCAFDVGESGRVETLATVKAQIGVIVPAHHPLTQLQEVSIGDCARFPVIAPDTEWLAHSTLRNLLEGEHSPLRIIARVERIGMLRNMVQAGLGIAFLSRVGMASQIEAGRIVWLPLVKGLANPTTISVMVQAGRVQPLYISSFADLLQEELATFAA